jgi:hypothetical protein
MKTSTLTTARFFEPPVSFDADQTLTMKAGSVPAGSARALAKLLLLSRP